MTILTDVFNWLRRCGSRASCEETVAEVRELTKTVLRSTDTLRQELERDRRELASLVESLKPKPETWRRFLGLFLSTVVLASIVAFVVSLIPPAFSSPPPNYGDTGIASLYVWANPLNDGQPDALRDPGVSLSAVADQKGSGLEYVATFPRRLAGDRFVLGIGGSAVLDDFRSSADVTNEYPGCQVQGQDGETVPHACQLITGIIPSESDELSAGCRSDTDEETISVRFSGNADLNSSGDWAHHITSLPYLGNVRGLGPGSVDDLVGSVFGPNFAPATLTTCFRLATNPEWTEYTPNFSPTSHVGDVMTWDPASNTANYVVVSTERGAQWKGNALLAILGVFGPALLTVSGMMVRSFCRLVQARRTVWS